MARKGRRRVRRPRNPQQTGQSGKRPENPGQGPGNSLKRAEQWANRCRWLKPLATVASAVAAIARLVTAAAEWLRHH